MNRMYRTADKGKGGPIDALATPTDISGAGVKAIAAAMNGLCADAFALYVKTKNFHWHMSGPHFRDYHLLLDEHGDQIYAMIDPMAERVRKLGETTLRSIGHIGKLQSIKDNDEAFVSPGAMLKELEHDNHAMAAALRKAHELCDNNKDIATASLLEVWVDETERRAWFLFETNRGADGSGH
jgi:starvation-inducible DNA-binding protein